MPIKMAIKQATSSKLEIDIQFASAAIEDKVLTIASLAAIKKWVKSSTHLSGLITLRFVNAAEGKKLNFAFRNKDYATNVLTFPYELTKKTLTADIIFCPPSFSELVPCTSRLLGHFFCSPQHTSLAIPTLP